MFTQFITPHKKPVMIDVPDEYIGHRLSITISEASEKESKKYSFENAVRFWEKHRINLADFKFDRAEANER